MVEAWIEIEDNEHIIEAEVEEAIGLLVSINVIVDEKSEEEEQDDDPMDISTKNEVKEDKEYKEDKENFPVIPVICLIELERFIAEIDR